MRASLVLFICCVVPAWATHARGLKSLTMLRHRKHYKRHHKTQEEHYRVECDSTKGKFALEIYREWSPLGVDRFLELVRDNFFTDMPLYRAVDNFLVQVSPPLDVMRLIPDRCSVILVWSIWRPCRSSKMAEKRNHQRWPTAKWKKDSIPTRLLLIRRRRVGDVDL
jgi:hypothetical protein